MEETGKKKKRKKKRGTVTWRQDALYGNLGKEEQGHPTPKRDSKKQLLIANASNQCLPTSFPRCLWQEEKKKGQDFLWLKLWVSGNMPNTHKLCHFVPEYYKIDDLSEP